MLRIERITIDDTNEVRYRISVRLQDNSRGVASGQSVDFQRELRVPRPFTPGSEEVALRSGINAFAEEIKHAMLQDMEMARTEHGTFDNTLRERENRESRARELQVRMMQAAPGLAPHLVESFMGGLEVSRGGSQLSQHRLAEAQQRLNQLSSERLRHLHGHYFAPDDEEAQEKRTKKKEIEEKAWSLLKEKIGEERWQQLEGKGYFEVERFHGTYRFYKHDSSGVRLIEDREFGKYKTRRLEWVLCIQSAVSDMPLGDIILARYLSMMNDEDEFLKTANIRQVKTKDEAIMGSITS